MNRPCYILLLVLFITQTTKGQNFIPNKNGYIENPKFRDIIISHGFQLVARFDTIQKKPLIIGAQALKNGKTVIIDPQGNILPQTSLKNIPVAVPVINSGSTDGISIEAPIEDKREQFEQLNQNGKYGTRNKITKKPGLPAVYDGLTWLGNGLVSFKKGEYVGLARTNGTILLIPKYKSVSILYDAGKAISPMYVVWDGTYFGLLNSSFEEVVAPKYGGIYNCNQCDLSDDLLNININSKQGLMTKQGKEILPPIYNQIRPLTLNVFLIRFNTKVGLADTTGKILIDPSLSYINYDKKTEQIQLTNGLKQGIADKKGNIIFPPIYDDIHLCKDGLFLVELNRKYGLADKRGELIIEPAYQHLFYSDNYLFAKNNDKYGLLNLKGDVLLPLIYDFMGYAKPNLFFKDKSTYGLMSITGKIITKFNYDTVDLQNNYLIVSKNGKYGVLDSQGKLLVPIKYDNIKGDMFFLHDGTTIATLNGKNYIIDLYGDEFAR